MYSFQPIVDATNDHTGFYIIVLIAILAVWMFVSDYIENNQMLPLTIGELLFVVAITGLSYYVSFKPVHPANKQVIGSFVSFQPEGYNELVGKSRSDYHYMYVVYSVDGQLIVLRAVEGLTYPTKAVLYKN